MAKAPATPLSAELLGVPKGAAAPAPDPISTPVQPAAPIQEPGVGQGAPAPAPAPETVPETVPQPIRQPSPAPRRRAPEPVPPPIDEVRTALTVRLPISTQERLREAAHRTRKEKQQIVDEALISWLNEQGY